MLALQLLTVPIPELTLWKLFASDMVSTIPVKHKQYLVVMLLG